MLNTFINVPIPRHRIMFTDAADYYHPANVSTLFFLQSGVKKFQTWTEIESTTFDLSSPSGAYDLLVMGSMLW